MRCCAANATTCSRLLNMNGPAPHVSAPMPRAASVEKAESISPALATSSTTRSFLIVRAADCRSLISESVSGECGLTSAAIVVALGASWRDQFQPLAAEHAVDKNDAGDVAAGPIEAGDEAVPHRVAAAGENDRNRRRCELGLVPGETVADDDGGLVGNGVCDQRGN